VVSSKINFNLVSELSAQEILEVGNRFAGDSYFGESTGISTDGRNTTLDILGYLHSIFRLLDINSQSIQTVLGVGMGYSQVPELCSFFSKMKRLSLVDVSRQVWDDIVLKTDPTPFNGSSVEVSGYVRNALELPESFSNKFDVVIHSYVFNDYFTKSHLIQAGIELTRSLRSGGIHIAISTDKDNLKFITPQSQYEPITALPTPLSVHIGIKL